MASDSSSVRAAPSGSSSTPASASGPKIDLIAQGWTLNTSEGRLGFCAVTLIDTGDRKILVDVAQVGRRLLILERLAQRGLAPTDIDTVVMTHAHWDHLLNADAFEHAEFVVHTVGRSYVRSPHANDWATPKYTNAIFERLRVREVREGDQVAPGVAVIETPGHTVGSLSVLVKVGGDTICVAGDALPHARSVFTRQPAIVFDTEEHASASIAKILDASDAIYPGHDRPFHRQSDGHIEYLTGGSITMFGVVDEGMQELQLTLKSEEPGPTWVMPR